MSDKDIEVKLTLWRFKQDAITEEQAVDAIMAWHKNQTAQLAYEQENDYKDMRRFQAKFIVSDNLVIDLRSKVKVLREALRDYGEHEKECILAQYRAGRPTEDGMYEMQYGYGKEMIWSVDRPPCSCGLTKALEQTKEDV